MKKILPTGEVLWEYNNLIALSGDSNDPKHFNPEAFFTQEPSKRVRCAYCGKWGDKETNCDYCGAPHEE